MSTEVILLLAIYAFILLGVFLGDAGPLATFQRSTPRLAARVERDISIGREFKRKTDGTKAGTWVDPQ